MSLEANKALVRRHIEEAFNNKHLDVINERVAPDFVDHTNPPDWPEGLKKVRQRERVLKVIGSSARRS